MTTLFVSDLHLSQVRPDKLTLFKDFLMGPAKKADALYILGDLFEDFWIGVDDMLPPNPDVMTALREFTQHTEIPLFIMCGNRDFHLNSDFADKTGSQLITDPTEINLGKEKVLLMHGDTLCTDDVKYQRWRRFITHPFIKWIYSIMPYALRKKIARNVRSYAADAVQKKPVEITDVTQDAVIKTMKEFNVDTLIHGHTHRRAMHDVSLGERQAQRIVLGDWYEEDSVLIHDDNGYRFERIDDYINSNR